ncbi:MAG TPA: iron-containing redox enzyme family protein [Acidimicrobiales bacterium]|jgi:hypothetical protein
MAERQGMAVVGELAAVADRSLQASTFFAGLRAGDHDLERVRGVFGQYYLWRNGFHRWFGVCIVRSPAFGTGVDTAYILSELTEHIDQEIAGDHHAMCRTFLEALGVDADAVRPLAVTDAYCRSFPTRYLDPARTGEEALAALAGRELVAPARNRLIVDALSGHYGVTAGLDFFDLHEDLEAEHFEALWEALTRTRSVDPNVLYEAASTEIVDHVRFWDDVFAAVAAPRWAMAGVAGR